MEYQDLVRDFAERTRHNLGLIREHTASGDEAYEVTQLINSMLGLLVLPQQRYYEQVPILSLDDLRAAGWPEAVLTGDIGEPSNLRDLFRYLRNGITHFNLEPTAINGKVDGVVIWNHEGGDRKKPRNWQVTLKLTELSEIANRFIDLVLETDREIGEVKVAYWTRLSERLDERGLRFKHAPIHPYRHLRFQIGRTEANIVSFAYFKGERESNVALELRGMKFESLYEALAAQRGEIDAEFGGKLIWDDKPGMKRFEIRTESPHVLGIEQTLWSRSIDWMIDSVDRMYRVLKPRVDAYYAEGNA